VRQIRIAVDPSCADRAQRLARAAGAPSLLRSEADHIAPDGTTTRRVILDLALPAPAARRLIAGLSRLPPGAWTLSSVHPRALRSTRTTRDETPPYPVPAAEIEADLWSFVHITHGLVIRVVLAAVLVAQGMLHGDLPMMIARLLFLPYHHALIAIAFAAVVRQPRLALRGGLVFLLTTLLIAGAGALTALAAPGPPLWEPPAGLATAIAIGAVVGAAAAIASADDAGRRELIGLAATAHLSVLPVWAGVVAVTGSGAGTGGPAYAARAADFAAAAAAITLAAALAFVLTGASRATP